MAAILDRYDPETTGRLELRALEKMIRALCEHTERLAGEARSRGKLATREAGLQLEAFAQRCAQARELLGAETRESCEIRIARLEKLVEALDCSRAYFRSTDRGAL